MCEANAAYNEEVEEGKGEEGGHARQQKPVIYQGLKYYKTDFIGYFIGVTSRWKCTL
jgi:hypothetical protein